MNKGTQNVSFIDDPRRIAKFPFADGVIVLNKQNLIAIERNLGSCMRIDKVHVSEYEDFLKLMGVLERKAGEWGYDELYYCDLIDDELYEMFIRYGFTDFAHSYENKHKFMTLNLMGDQHEKTE